MRVRVLDSGFFGWGSNVPVGTVLDIQGPIPPALAHMLEVLVDDPSPEAELQIAPKRGRGRPRKAQA